MPAGLKFSVILAAVLLVGCSAPPPELISPERFLPVASNLVLDPNTPCGELTATFGVPHLEPVDNPGDADLPYEEAFVANPAGESLRVWYLPADFERGVAVISIGSSGNAACYLYMAQILRDTGWSIVVYDYQGFGGSTGAPSLASLYDDLGVVIDWTLERTGRTELSLVGVSIGTVPTIAQAAARPEQVNAVILDAPVWIPAELEQFEHLLEGPLDAFIETLDPTLRAEQQLPNMHQPTLVFIYGRDHYKSSKRFAELIAAGDTPVLQVNYDELPHARGPYVETATYFFLIDQLLAGVWSDLDLAPTDGPLAID